mgnify:CR=1 FL=1
MNQLVIGYDEDVQRWVASQLGTKPVGDAVAIGVARQGKPIAGVVYHDLRLCMDTGEPLSVEATIASSDPRWASRRVLYTFFAYPFLQLKAKRLTTLCNADDADVVSFNKRLGFVKESVLRYGWSRKHNAVLWRMTAGECRWIR